MPCGSGASSPPVAVLGVHARLEQIPSRLTRRTSSGRPEGNAGPAEPDPARLVGLLPACRLHAHPATPPAVHLVADRVVAEDPAPLAVDRRAQAPDRPHRPVEADQCRWAHSVQPREGGRDALPLPRSDPQPLGPAMSGATVESPLRREAYGGSGERPGETGWQRCQHRAPGRLFITAWADHGQAGNGEPLATMLRPGNAGPDTAADTSRRPGSRSRSFQIACGTRCWSGPIPAAARTSSSPG